MFGKKLIIAFFAAAAALPARAGLTPHREAPLLAMVGLPGPGADAGRLDWIFDHETRPSRVAAGQRHSQRPARRSASGLDRAALNTPKALDGPWTPDFKNLPESFFIGVPDPMEAGAYHGLLENLSAHPDVTDRYDPIIEKYAAIYHLDPRLIKAVIAAESGFFNEARSDKGARGLMQVVPRTASYFGIASSRLFFMEDNIAAGSAYLASLFGNILGRLGLAGTLWGTLPDWVIRRVVAAYHCGPRALSGRGLCRATRLYVRKVMLLYHSRISRIRNRPPRLLEERLFSIL